MRSPAIPLILLVAASQCAGAPSTASYRLETRALLSSSVGLDIEAAPLQPDARAAANRPTHLAKAGDRAFVDLGQVDIVTNFGTMGKVFDLKEGVRIVLDVALKARVSAARQAELQVRLEPNLANGFSRVAMSTDTIDWTSAGGVTLTSGAPYVVSVPVGATTKNLQLAFDLGYGQPPGQRSDTITLDLIGSL